MQSGKSTRPGIPDKLYFKIGEVSAIAGLPTYVLRFWETEFPKIQPKRTPAGQRLYRQSDVELILDIKHLLYDKKFTIPGAKKHLGKKSHTTKKNSAETILNEIRQELQEIRHLLS